MPEANLNDLMKKAQEMQKKMQWVQHELTSTEVTGESGGGMIKVTMNGRHDVKNISISDEAMKEGKQILGDLIAAATNDAVHKVEKLSQEKMIKLTKDLGLPTDAGSGTNQGQ